MAQLDIALDRGSDMPLGTQLAWQLRTLIASGRLSEGERLPGVREMAGLAGVNVNAVQDGLRTPRTIEGLIVFERGRGTFVGERSRRGTSWRARARGGRNGPGRGDRPARAGGGSVRGAAGAEPRAGRGRGRARGGPRASGDRSPRAPPRGRPPGIRSCEIALLERDSLRSSPRTA